MLILNQLNIYSIGKRENKTTKEEHIGRMKKKKLTKRINKIKENCTFNNYSPKCVNSETLLY